MTNLEKETRERNARLTRMLDLLDSETKRMQEFQRRIQRQDRLRRRGRSR